MTQGCVLSQSGQIYVFPYVVRNSRPTALHAPEVIATRHVREPAVATVLSQDAPPTFVLVVPVRLASRKLPVLAVTIPALPRFEETIRSQSLGSEVVTVIAGLAELPVAVAVSPSAATPEYSSTVRLYRVVPVKVGVTEETAAQ
jgi:hypothetical protein